MAKKIFDKGRISTLKKIFLSHSDSDSENYFFRNSNSDSDGVGVGVGFRSPVQYTSLHLRDILEFY